MVGVGGRSKACETCRRRRIKCDETRPKCQRCTKSKLECGGYRSIAIIQYHGGNSQQVASKISSSSKHSVNPQVHFAPINLSDPTTWQTSYSSLGLSLLPITPSHDDVYISYTLSHLLQDQAKEDMVLNGIDRRLSDKCFLALATTYFGFQHEQRIVSEHGLQRYSYALKHLNQVLGNSSKYRSYDLLESVTVMILFEFLISKNADGWTGHSRGLECLMELRGPASFSSTPERSIFERTRASIILAALVLHKSTILSRPEWKWVPWEQTPDEKSEMHFLLDILADCPDLFVQKDKVSTEESSCERNLMYQSLLNRIHDLLHQLENWERAWSIRHEDYYFEIPAPATAPKRMNLSGDWKPIWSTIIQYQSLYHANVMSLYNATLILLLKLTQELAYTFGVTPSDGQSFPNRMYAAGIEICRSVDYHLQGIRKGAWSFYLLFPLRMAWDSVGQFDPAIGAWLKILLQESQSGSAGRWAIAGYLLQMRPPTTVVQSSSE